MSGVVGRHDGEAARLLDQNCWPDWPQWECYGANIAGLVSTALWFIVLVPQVLKNWWRRSVVGLSFLWAVANFTASLVNLFFAFWVNVPLYVKVSAVYMPILEFTILCQFMLYSLKPFTTRLLALLACLILWGTIIELELNFPESRDKIQWVAIALWSIETFPQVILNIKLQSTAGQSSLSVFIALVGKTTDFVVNYGLNLPLPYVVMTYFSSSSAFLNAFQVFSYGKKRWSACKRKWKSGERDEEKRELLNSEVEEVQNSSNNETSETRLWNVIVAVLRTVGVLYVSIGLVCFAVGLFWRTKVFYALLGPITVFGIVFLSSEYYSMKNKGWLKRCEEIHGRMTRKRKSHLQEIDRASATIQ